MLFFLFLSFSPLLASDDYSLSLHDALPIFAEQLAQFFLHGPFAGDEELRRRAIGEIAFEDVVEEDRKSTRLNSSHLVISYAVFCLKKKKCNNTTTRNAEKDLLFYYEYVIEE